MEAIIRKLDGILRTLEITSPGGARNGEDTLYTMSVQLKTPTKDCKTFLGASSGMSRNIGCDGHHRTRIYLSLVLGDFAQVTIFLGFSFLNN